MPELHILVSLLEQFQGPCPRLSHSCWDLSSSLCTFAVIAVKRTAASGMELQIGSIWRSLSLKGSRLCGGLGSLPATARPFSEFHPTLLLIFFFFLREKLVRIRTRTGDLHNSPHLFPNSFRGCRARLRCLLITSSLNYLKESRFERGRPSREERGRHQHSEVMNVSWDCFCF